MRLLVIGMMSMVLALYACKATKKIQTAISNTDTSAVVTLKNPAVDSAALIASILNKVHANEIDFQYFLGKIKVDFTDNSGKNTNATAFVRIRKDSLMWVSLTGALGVEGYRILIRPDSVFVMDKLEKTYAARSVSYLQEIIKLPMDFSVLQALIIGNPVFFTDNIVSFKNNAEGLMALSIGPYFKHMITLDTSNNSITHSKLDDIDVLRNRTCDITLNNYMSLNQRLFSNNREITVTEKSKLDIKLEFKQVTFDEVQSFPFNIPKNYQLK